MTEPLSIREEQDALVVTAGAVEIARYVFEPDAPTEEAPKPFLHPLRTLSGAPLTVYRPWDHRWHKGLQMTWSHVSGQNFWGGPTFGPEEGYRWRDNLGSIRHEAFTSRTGSGAEVAFTEVLSWHASTGERWIAETRTHRFFAADAGTGVWALDFSTELANARGDALVFGSPTTHGRPAAGYAGFFWRGPRAWTGGTVTSAHDGAEGDPMGAEAEWLAISGEHDEIDGGGTVLAYAGTSSAAAPIKWFVRADPFAAIAPSPSFDEEIVLEQGEALRLKHRLVFVDRVVQGDALTALAAEFRP